jgi:phosphopantetheine--protein transferase-like protein
MDAVTPGAVLAELDLAVRASPRAPASDGLLHPDEVALAAAMPDARAVIFLSGRAALRAAMRAVAPDAARSPVLRTHRGAPALPIGVAASISHKQTRAVALAVASTGVQVGVDLEELPTVPAAPGRDLAGRILTADELDALDGLDPLERQRAVLLRFSLKEAVYKAIDPHVGRYVRFTEVALRVHDDGTAAVRLLLPEPQVAPLRVRAAWRIDQRLILTAAIAETA